jgi:hypothetical protein
VTTPPAPDLNPQRKVRCKCRVCKKVDEFTLPKKGFHPLSRGKKHEVAFPGIDPARLVELQTQVCPTCQSKEVEQRAQR